jgi:Protein of unknown function (DUF1416)
MSAPARAGQLLLAFLLGAGVVGAMWAVMPMEPTALQPAPQSVPIDDAFVWPEVDGLSVPLTGARKDGTFRFDGLPEGDALLRVESDEYVRRLVRFSFSADTVPIEIVLEKGGRVHGRVFDEHGQPVSRVYLFIKDPEDGENRERMAWPHVEADGSFSVHLSPGRYHLRGLAGKTSGEATLKVEEGETLEVTLRLAAR